MRTLKQLNLGIDFGTNNTLFAFTGENGTEIARHFNQKEVGCRSCLFFPEKDFGTEFSIGTKAITDYLSSVHGGEEGRILLSIKHLMTLTDIDSIRIYDAEWSPVELMGAFLKKLKNDFEEKYMVRIPKVTICRPVTLSSNPSCDRYLERRLLSAMDYAGFEQVKVIPEPISALLGFETELEPGTNVLVADFGAGTSDFCVAKIPADFKDIPTLFSSVLSTSGVSIGGDILTRNLFLEYATPHFGKDAQYKLSSTSLGEIPTHYYTLLTDWCNLWKLRDARNVEALKNFIFNAGNPEDKNSLLRLKRVIEENLSFELFESVEAGKKSLSESDVNNLVYRRDGTPEICLDKPVTAEMFEQVVSEEIREIDKTIDIALERASMSSEDIGSVIMTGGTSLAKPIRNLLVSKFPGKVAEGDLLTAVAKGASRYSACY